MSNVCYLSTDSVNAEHALWFAAERGLAMELREPRDGEPPPQTAVLLDWDHLPAGWRQDLVKRLRSSPGPLAVAIHSYHVCEHERHDLRQLGVAVFRTLEQALGHSSNEEDQRHQLPRSTARPSTREATTPRP